MKEARLKKLKKHLYQKEEIIFAYIYGSVARNQDTSRSDIDLAVYIDEDKKPEAGPFGYRSELITELQPLAGNDIDLIILNEASNLLAYNVFKEGKLLFNKDPELRTEIQAKTVDKYLDFLPMLKVQEKYLNERIDSKRFGG
ncbi:MAG: type VII toxin-antitoxin system MntA family adenylyltransferase antitoxin [Bacillota bacterium]